MGAELDGGLQNAERTVFISQVSDGPWRRQDPRPGKRRQKVGARGDSHCRLWDQALEGRVAP